MQPAKIYFKVIFPAAVLLTKHIVKNRLKCFVVFYPLRAGSEVKHNAVRSTAVSEKNGELDPSHKQKLFIWRYQNWLVKMLNQLTLLPRIGRNDTHVILV
jgi:hypothetical protein